MTYTQNYSYETAKKKIRIRSSRLFFIVIRTLWSIVNEMPTIKVFDKIIILSVKLWSFVRLSVFSPTENGIIVVIFEYEWNRYNSIGFLGEDRS